MARTRLRAARAVAAAGVLLVVGPSAIAGAQTSDEMRGRAAPRAAPGFVQSVACSASWLDPRHPRTPSAHLAQLGMERAWMLSRGRGQVIAVIDTGVAPHPRLPRLRGAGDLLGSAEGLEDCDAHGTLVAGLAAASPGAEGFSGMAPEAEIVSVRQSSAAFRPTAPGTGTPAVGPTPPSAPTHSPADAPKVVPDTVEGSGSVRTLAAAVRRAADAGATVINISEVACVPRGTLLADAELTEALRYAVLERDIVVVVAAGNVEGPCSTGNPVFRDPRDPTGMEQLRTVASPASYDDLVVAVGAVDDRGAATEFSLPGPWVDVAAPGTGLTSLSVTGPGSIGPVPETATAVVDGHGRLTSLDGTSFAAPLVAGLAALVRARFPELTAPQVAQRIVQTALSATGDKSTDLRIGAGMIDPVAALSAPGPLAQRRATDPVALEVPAPEAPNIEQRRRAGQLAMLAAVVTASVLGGLAWRRALAPEAHRSSR